MKNLRTRRSPSAKKQVNDNSSKLNEANNQLISHQSTKGNEMEFKGTPSR